jgi:hypothetical protein
MSNLFSGLFGNGGDDARKQALDAVQGVPLPILQKQNPELYKQVIALNPSLVQNVNQGQSAMDGIALDPAYKQAQMNALAKLQDISSNSGNDFQNKADTNNMISTVNQQLQGQEGAIQQNLATRGLSGGMSEMVQRQMAAQNASNQAANSGINLQAQAQQRALQALMSQNSVASGLSNQDFSQQSAKANADDAISRFNANNLQNSNNTNAAAQNTAAQWNANNQQGVANKNTDLTNTANQWNTNGMAQQNYNNQMGKATGVANQYGNIASGEDRSRQSNAALTGSLVSAGAGAYGAYAAGKKANPEDEQ